MAAGGGVRPRVLVVDDDVNITAFLKRALAYEGYQVVTAADGHAGLAAARDHPPDLVILDIMLPGLDGLEILHRLRDAGLRMPVILVTARSEEADRVGGLRLGADDYVVKPFSPAELIARVAAVLRRGHADGELPAPPLAFGGLEIQPAGRVVLVDGHEFALTQREFDLLLFLASRPGQVFSRDQLMDAVWRFPFYSDTTTVTVHIRRLRAKIEPDPAQPRYIETVWGVGYRFRP